MTSRTSASVSPTSAMRDLRSARPACRRPAADPFGPGAGLAGAAAAEEEPGCPRGSRHEGARCRGPRNSHSPSMRSISARLSVARNAVSSSLVAPCLDKTSVKLIRQLDEAAAWILCVMVEVLRLKRLRLKRLCLNRLRLCVKRLLDAPYLLEHACDGGELPRRPGRVGARPAQALALEVGDDVVGEALGARDGLGRVGRLRRVRRGVPARGASPLPLPSPGVRGGGGGGGLGLQGALRTSCRAGAAAASPAARARRRTGPCSSAPTWRSNAPAPSSRRSGAGNRRFFRARASRSCRPWGSLMKKPPGAGRAGG